MINSFSNRIDSIVKRPVSSLLAITALCIAGAVASAFLPFLRGGSEDSSRIYVILAFAIATFIAAIVIWVYGRYRENVIQARLNQFNSEIISNFFKHSFSKKEYETNGPKELKLYVDLIGHSLWRTFMPKGWNSEAGKDSALTELSDNAIKGLDFLGDIWKFIRNQKYHTNLEATIAFRILLISPISPHIEFVSKSQKKGGKEKDAGSSRSAHEDTYRSLYVISKLSRQYKLQWTFQIRLLLQIPMTFSLYRINGHLFTGAYGLSGLIDGAPASYFRRGEDGFTRYQKQVDEVFLGKKGGKLYGETWTPPLDEWENLSEEGRKALEKRVEEEHTEYDLFKIWLNDEIKAASARLDGASG